MWAQLQKAANIFFFAGANFWAMQYEHTHQCYQQQCYQQQCYQQQCYQQQWDQHHSLTYLPTQRFRAAFSMFDCLV